MQAASDGSKAAQLAPLGSAMQASSAALRIAVQPGMDGSAMHWGTVGVTPVMVPAGAAKVPLPVTVDASTVMLPVLVSTLPLLTTSPAVRPMLPLFDTTLPLPPMVSRPPLPASSEIMPASVLTSPLIVSGLIVLSVIVPAPPVITETGTTLAGSNSRTVMPPALLIEIDPWLPAPFWWTLPTSSKPVLAIAIGAVPPLIVFCPAR